MQGACGMCWAYSTIEMMEANLAIHRNLSKTLSVQQMVDCAENGNEGCNGGDSCLLLQWLIENRVNIRTGAEYPISKTGQFEKCKIPAEDSAIGTEVYRPFEYACNRCAFHVIVILKFHWFL